MRDGEAGARRPRRAVDRAFITVAGCSTPSLSAPHLTLARSDGVPAGSAIAARLVAAAADLDVRFRADQIGLYESLTGGGPARYEPIEVVRLG